MVSNKIFLSSAILIGALIFLYFAVWPAYQELGVLSGAIASSKLMFSQGEKLSGEIAEFRGKLDEEKENVAKLDYIFLDNEAGGTEDVIRLSQELAGRHGLIAVDIKTGQKFSEGLVSSAGPARKSSDSDKSSQEQRLFALPVELRLGGSYDNFKVLMESIGSYLPIMTVQSFSIHPPTKVEEKLFLFDIKILFYFYGNSPG